MSRLGSQRFSERPDRRPEIEPPPDRLVWNPIVVPTEQEESAPLEDRSGRRLRGWVVLAMFFTIIIVALRWFTSIYAFLSSMGDIGSRGRTMEEKTVGLIAFGLCGIFVVAIVRILKE